MKLSVKLIIGFLAIILLMGTAIFLSVYNYKRVQDEYELLKEDVIPGAFVMNVMEYHGNQIHLFTVWYTLRGEKKDELQTAMLLLEKAGGEYLESETHIGPEEQEAARVLQEKIKKVNSISAELVSLKNQGVSIEEILKKGREEFYPALESLIKEIGGHKAVHMKELEETKETISKLHVFNIYFVLLIDFLMIVLAVIIAVLTVRSISKPVQNLVRATKIIGDGNLDYKVDIRAKDEIGQLSVAFNKMTGDLKKTTTSINMLNKEISAHKKAEKVLEETKKELEDRAWGLEKANEGIKALYKELEEKNKELQKLDQLKSDFISTVSHEIRTPLSITKEGISLVLDRIPGDINEKQSKVLIAAKGNIDRLTRIINELLDISKIEAGKVALRKEQFDITELTRKVISDFEIEVRKKGLELKFDIPKSNIFIVADKDKIIQVFTNLLNNAVKNTEKGYIKVSVHEKKKEVECSVIDTGIGVSKEDIPKIFDKFKQFGRKEGPGDKGTGLGLSIAKGIIDMHKGKILVESPPKGHTGGFGKGTKFTFILPKKY